jgi:hypothetical protein
MNILNLAGLPVLVWFVWRFLWGPFLSPTTTYHVPPTINWNDLQSLLAADTPPSSPVLVKFSPQQKWLSTKVGNVLWTPAQFTKLSQTIESVGSTMVNLRSSTPRMKTNNNSFTHYYNSAHDRRHATATAKHTTTRTKLREALQKIWGNSSGAQSLAAPVHYYLAPDTQSLPPELLPYDPTTLLTFIPDGCLLDDTRHPLVQESEQCRGLSSTMWIGQSGGVSAAMHYDLQHNFYVQASGMKRFNIIAPSNHPLLDLYPRWHGSQRQGQVHYPTIAHQVASKTYVAELQKGDALYLPPLWLHYVESMQGGVATNFWTDSLCSDLWKQLLQTFEPIDSADPYVVGGSEGGNWNALYDKKVNALIQAKAMVDIVLSQVDGLFAARKMQGLHHRGKNFTTTCIKSCSSGRCNGIGRAGISQLCTSSRSFQVKTSVRVVLNSYASGLNGLEEGSRSLLLSEWVDEFILFAIKKGGHRVSCVEIYVDECFEL